MRRAARHPSDIEYAAKAVTFAMTSLATLTDEQADHFVQHGYVAVPGCVDPELAQRWTDLAYRRLGYDPDDPATWERGDRVDGPPLDRAGKGDLAARLRGTVRRGGRRAAH